MGLYKKYQAYINQLESMEKVEDREVKKIATSDKTLLSLLNITEMNLNLFKIIRSQDLDDFVISSYLRKQEAHSGIHNCFRYITNAKGTKNLQDLIDYLCDGAIFGYSNNLESGYSLNPKVPEFDLAIDNEDYCIKVAQEYNSYHDVARGIMLVMCDNKEWYFYYEM